MHSKHDLPTSHNVNLSTASAAAGNLQGQTFLPSRHLRDRYDVSDMTLWRWCRDEEVDFPQPIYIKKRRYWRLADIEAWEARQSSKVEAA